MKPIFRLGLAALSLSATSALAQNTDQHLVKIVGDLNPTFTVEINEKDLKQLKHGLESMGALRQIEVDVNELYSEKDRQAFSETQQEIARVILESAKILVDMRAIIYKLDTSLQLTQVETARAKIQQVLQNKFQSQYRKLLGQFLGHDSTVFNKTLTETMAKCFSQLCVSKVYEAQLDLRDFGFSINSRIDLANYRDWKLQHKTFRSVLVKDAIRRAIDQVLVPNEEKSLSNQMVRIAAVPFVSAAAGLGESVDQLFNFLNPSSFRLNIKSFAADPIDRKEKVWLAMEQGLTNIMADNMGYIVDLNKGGRLYKEPVVVVEKKGETTAVAPAAHDNCNDVNCPIKHTKPQPILQTAEEVDVKVKLPALGKQLEALNGQFESMRKVGVVVDKDLVTNAILGVIANFGLYNPLLQEPIGKELNATLRTGNFQSTNLPYYNNKYKPVQAMSFKTLTFDNNAYLFTDGCDASCVTTQYSGNTQIMKSKAGILHWFWTYANYGKYFVVSIERPISDFIEEFESDGKPQYRTKLVLPAPKVTFTELVRE